MSKITVIGGVAKLPVGFELLGVVNTARFIMRAPDGTDVELNVDIKAFDSQEFFESMDKFKEQISQLQE